MAKFRMWVTSGIEYHTLAGLTKYDLDNRIDTLREWFGHNIEVRVEVEDSDA